ncbi:Mob1/phocein [Mycena vulgaris]|nr:Mob1/phocein [Mycena vulgaris]
MAQVQLQRPLRGSRISTFYPIKNLPSLSSLDSAFQLQEYISLLIRLDVHDVDAIVSVPGRGKQKAKEKETDAADDGKDRKAEVTVDEACWKYEQLRRLAQDLSHPLITMLQQVCTRTTCPEMKAGEWLYLCVAHGNDGAMEQCCAIDYILHTLDSATALLNSPRAFPSRLQIPPTSHRHFTSLARRLGRIFAHAYFHHREEFEQAEAESSLYARFLALTEKFDLVPADFLVIPPRAVAAPGERRGSMVPMEDVPPPTLLGAALHVDTGPPAALAPDAGREKSASPPGLDDAASPRRYGRSRTDTMMLEGDKDRDGRFPASPASAVEEGSVGLDAALAAASAQKMMSNLPSVSASPVVMLPSQTVAEPEQEPEQEAEREEAQESPSPTSDEEGGLEPPAGTAMPVVSPSSSTAPQSEGPIRFNVEHGREDAAVDAPVPTISIEPATPPAVDEAEDKELDSPEPAAPVAEKVKEEQSAAAAAAEEEDVVASPVAPVVAEPEAAADEAAAGEPQQLETPEKDAVEEAVLASAAVEAPAIETAPAPAPAADEEVDVTDSEKDVEVEAVGAVAPSTPAEAPPKAAEEEAPAQAVEGETEKAVDEKEAEKATAAEP